MISLKIIALFIVFSLLLTGCGDREEPLIDEPSMDFVFKGQSDFNGNIQVSLNNGSSMTLHIKDNNNSPVFGIKAYVFIEANQATVIITDPSYKYSVFV